MNTRETQLFLENEKLKDSLKTILMNTIHRDLGGDYVYKAGILSNIEMALGKEEYDHLVEIYS